MTYYVDIVSIHAPRAGRDCSWASGASAGASFNPRAPRGARLGFTGSIIMPTAFQSTRPARGATLEKITIYTNPEFQSTRPARGATRSRQRHRRRDRVSIHAPRAGRDEVRHEIHRRIVVSIHAPRAGRDVRSVFSGITTGVFQSTRPARGATITSHVRSPIDDVSIHAPRAGRDQRILHLRWQQPVSIHAPRAGRDEMSAR